MIKYISLICEVRDSRSGAAKDSSLSGCHTVLSGKRFSMFRRPWYLCLQGSNPLGLRNNQTTRPAVQRYPRTREPPALKLFPLYNSLYLCYNTSTYNLDVLGTFQPENFRLPSHATPCHDGAAVQSLMSKHNHKMQAT